jgi:hypothetical protein
VAPVFGFKNREKKSPAKKADPANLAPGIIYDNERACRRIRRYDVRRKSWKQRFWFAILIL